VRPCISPSSLVGVLRAGRKWPGGRGSARGPEGAYRGGCCWLPTTAAAGASSSIRNNGAGHVRAGTAPQRSSCWPQRSVGAHSQNVPIDVFLHWQFAHRTKVRALFSRRLSFFAVFIRVSIWPLAFSVDAN